jgi:cytochrome c553
MRLKRTFASMFVLLVVAGLAIAESGTGSPERGKTLARGCVCHRGDLDAMPADKFVGLMLDYKTGKREHKTMNKQAARLTEQDIEDLAAWFASK